MELDVGTPFGSAAVNIPTFNDGQLSLCANLIFASFWGGVGG